MIMYQIDINDQTFFFYLAAYLVAISILFNAPALLYLALSFVALFFAWSLFGFYFAGLLTLSEFFLISSWIFLNNSSTDLTPAY